MLNNALGVSLLATGWVSMQEGIKGLKRGAKQVGLIPAMAMYATSCYLNRLRGCKEFHFESF